MFFVFVCGLKSGETCHFEQNLNHLEATFSHGGFWSVSIGVLYEMTFSLLSSCFLHAKLISPSLHIWKSHEIPMASPSSHEITILHQISHHYLAGKTPWVSRVISFFFNPSPGNWPTNVRPILNKVPRGQMVQSWGKALGMQWNGSAGYNFCIWCCTCGSNVWADVFTLLFHLNLNGSSPTKSGFIIFDLS